jgi:hypothetical protein
LKSLQFDETTEGYNELNERVKDRIKKLKEFVREVEKERESIGERFTPVALGKELDLNQLEYMNVYYPYMHAKQKQQEDNNQEKNQKNVVAVNDIKKMMLALTAQLDKRMTMAELLNKKDEIQFISRKIRENLEYYADTDINKLRVKKIFAFEKKVRAVELITRCKRGSIQVSDLTSEELALIWERAGKPVSEIREKAEESDSKIKSKDILEYAQNLYNLAEVNYINEKNQFIKQDSVKKYFSERSAQYNRGRRTVTECKHTGFNKLFMELSNLSVSQLRDSHWDCVQKIAIKTRIHDREMDPNQKKKIETDIRNLTYRMQMCQIVKRLHRDNYTLHGDSKAMKEPLLRSLDSINTIPAFREINDEELFEMMSKLSEGAFYEEDTENTLLYKQHNLEGFKLYKEKIFKHYKYLYTKYGVRYPELDYVYEHYQEFEEDLINLQVDTSITQIPGVYDRSNPEEKAMMDYIGYLHEMLGFFKVQIFRHTKMSDYELDGKTLSEDLKEQWDKNYDKRAIRLKEIFTEKINVDLNINEDYSGEKKIMTEIDLYIGKTLDAVKASSSLEELVALKDIVRKTADMIRSDYSNLIISELTKYRVKEILLYEKKIHYAEIQLDHKALYSEDRELINERNAYRNIMPEHISQYARDEYVRIEKEIQETEKHILDSEAAWKEFKEEVPNIKEEKYNVITDTNHVEFSREIFEYRKHDKIKLKEMYFTYKKEYIGLNELIQNENNEAKKQNYLDTMKKIRRSMTMCEIAVKLRERYVLYGDNTYEADLLMRSITDMDFMISIRDMSNEEIFEMTSMMSIGVFEKDEQNEATRKSYHDLNLEGMKIYKQKVFEKHKFMYKKYGLKYPTIVELIKNYRAFYIDSASIQIDESILKLPGLIDENNPEDRMMKSIIAFHQTMFHEVNSSVTMLCAALEGPLKDDQYKNEYENDMKNKWELKLEELAEVAKQEIENARAAGVRL